ncbi:hypothetical protein CB1_000683001 [Camelus ferus]|nr:hypothetical protein CB1_000683001 [Camelus ferus]
MRPSRLVSSEALIVEMGQGGRTTQWRTWEGGASFQIFRGTWDAVTSHYPGSSPTATWALEAFGGAGPQDEAGVWNCRWSCQGLSVFWKSLCCQGRQEFTAARGWPQGITCKGGTVTGFVLRTISHGLDGVAPPSQVEPPPPEPRQAPHQAQKVEGVRGLRLCSAGPPVKQGLHHSLTTKHLLNTVDAGIHPSEQDRRALPPGCSR